MIDLGATHPAVCTIEEREKHKQRNKTMEKPTATRGMALLIFVFFLLFIVCTIARTQISNSSTTTPTSFVVIGAVPVVLAPRRVQRRLAAAPPLPLVLKLVKQKGHVSSSICK